MTLVITLPRMDSQMPAIDVTTPMPNDILSAPVDDDDNCSQFSLAEEEALQFCIFWVEGVALTIMAMLGLLANAISMVILNKRDLRTFFSSLLIVLLAFDSVYLVLSVVEALRRNFKLISDVHIYLFPYFLYPVHSLFMAASIYMTIAIAVERYRAVVYPLSLRLTLLMTKRMIARRLRKYVLIVVLCAVAISIPRFFELRIATSIKEEEDSIFNNRTAEESVDEDEDEDYWGRPRIETTSLRTDSNYNVYYVNLTRFACTGAGPMALLAFFYYRIFQAVRGHNAEHIQLSTSPLDETARRKQEAALSNLFINIILVFLVCHTPRVIVNVKEMMVIDKAEECFAKGMSAYGIWVHIAVCFSHFLLVANASVNIIFYIWHNKGFKRHFVSMFKIRPPDQANSIIVSSPSSMLRPLRSFRSRNGCTAAAAAATVRVELLEETKM